ncbi:MAG: PAS domain-containing hybrid sensor histidine kinase/response regulator [Pyrinomonadaceae bacterium]
METDEKEERLPRSGALQNARSIQLARNTSEREGKKTEGALRASEERFRSLVLASAQVVWTTNPDGLVEEDSPSWRAFTGQTYEQWKGQGWLDAIHPDDREATKETWLRCVADKCICETEYRVRAANGSYRWTAVRAVPVLNPDGSIREWVGMNNDITERKRTEEALRESNQRITNIVEGITDAFVTVDKDWRFTYLNQRAEEILLPLKKSRENLRGKNFWQEFPDLVGTVGEENYRRCQLALGNVLEINGNAVFGWIGADFKPSAERRVKQFKLHRHLAENALRESEELYRVLFGSVPVAVFVCDRDAVIQHYNSRAVELWGREPTCGVEQHCGSCKLFLPDGTLLPHPESPMVEVLRTGIPANNVEVFIERPDGSRIPVIVNFAALKNAQGEITGAITTFDDISELKRAQEALRESAERFRFMAESMPQKIFTAKPSGDVDYFNAQWLEFTGLTFEQIRDWGWTQFIHPDDVGENIRRWKYSIETGDYFQLEHRFRRKDGTYHWHLSRAHAMRDAEGKVLMWIGSNTEIDDQKRAEVELKELMKREREARATAEIANRVKDEFLAIVSHELRTPLNAIVGWAQLLKSGTLDQRESERAIQTIDRNAKAQGTIINELLDTSRIISGKLKLDRQPIDLAGVINAALDVVRPASDAKAIEIVAVVEPEAGLVAGDSVRLQQVVWNLLSNAVKFTPKKGRIEVQLKRAGTDVVIVVRDTGMGIPPDFLPHIFERFQQADTSEKRTHGGLGLGLSIVRNLVEMHSGNVQAESEGEGLGATFVVTLPIMAVSGVINARPEFQVVDSELRVSGAELHDEDAEEQRDLELKSDILAGVRVLAVDDQPDTRDLIILALTRYGAEVRACTSATEALNMIQEWKPEVIVSDIGLPDEDGYDLMRKIRALESECGGQIPAVALTGYASAADEAKAHAAGYQVHIAKPVQLRELVATIAKLSGLVIR